MEINEYLLKFFQIVKELESVELFPETASLSGTEFRMLREIIMEGEKNKSIISSELARRLGVTRSAVSQIVTKLEKKDIIRRVPSETDKKIAYLKLTPRTEVIFEEQCRRANAIMAKVIDEFGDWNMDALVNACSTLSRTFRKVSASTGKASNVE